MDEKRRFGIGERVKYAKDWPELENPVYTIARGTSATVVLVPDGPREMYLVRLDTPVWGEAYEMSVAGRYQEPE